MTYQVLARKWRPRSFDTLIGQDHVVRALSHALDTQRLHHAWLFTGTRGVGKTTLARILAKALNCEQGVTATPCGHCRACTEIDQGRFVDYVELDAASNRGVDEMTQLLEQAVYAPSAARYKVYMIDEVHMLTGHAFNAMLKTLEEPPAHVKFILATTDPQKIPVTVLSRCLQFNLKQMTVPAIETHLAETLAQEQIPAEAPALRLLAQAAAGSMRDALSLTDQAIAYSAGSVSTDAVQSMLGTIDQGHLLQLLRALIEGNGAQLIAIADDMLLRGLSFSAALADLAILLSRIAIQQRVPGALPPDEPNIQGIIELAQLLSADHVQLFYSVAVHSRDELSLAPDEYAGFVMACMRLFALTPAGSLPQQMPSAPESTPLQPQSSPVSLPTSQSVPVANPPTAPAVASTPSAPVAPSPQPAVEAPSTQPTVVAPVENTSMERGHAIDPTPVMPQSTVSTQADTPPWDSATPASIAQTGRSGIQPPMVERGVQQISAGAASAAVDTPPWESQSAVSVAAVAMPEAETHRVLAPAVLPTAATPEPSPQLAQSIESAPSALGAPSVEAPFYDEPPVDDSAYDGISQEGDNEDFSTEEVESGDNTPPMDNAIQLAVAALDLPTSSRLQADKLSSTQWTELAPTLALSGWAAELAQQAKWQSCDGQNVVLLAKIRSADDSQAKARINTVLNEYFGQVLRLHIEYGDAGNETAFAVAEAERAVRQQQAETDAQQNPFILSLIQQFDAQIVPDTIQAK